MAEVWEATLQGVKSYGAFGPRDVLLIASSEGLEGPDIVPRRRGQLTAEDHSRLASQGIPADCWQDDLKLMQQRYARSDMCSLQPLVSVKGEVPTSVQTREKIRSLMADTTKPGVILHYIGPGRRHTGDWCFADGFIQFSDLLDAYMQHFHGKSKCLTVISDCSFSGKWVAACRQFLDEVKVQPCGHSGRGKGVLVKVRTSCRSYETPYTLLYSVRGVCSDKNLGVPYLRPDGYEVEQTQHARIIDSTLVTCRKGASFQDPCSLPQDYTWHKQNEGERVRLVRGEVRGRRAWHYVLVVDDEETMEQFTRMSRSGAVDVTDYGQVVKSGWGEGPSQQVREWIRETYP